MRYQRACHQGVRLCLRVEMSLIENESNHMPENIEEREAAIERMAKFLDILRGEDDLGIIIRAHIHIEHELTEFIEARLSEPSILKPLRPTYEDKVLLAVGLGFLPEYQAALSNIGKLRNDFAHNLRGTLGKQEANNLRKAMAAEALEIARRSYVATREKLASDRPEGLEQQQPRDEIVLYLVSLWSALATAAIQAKAVK